jgi:hypothetical protein
MAKEGVRELRGYCGRAVFVAGAALVVALLGGGGPLAAQEPAAACPVGIPEAARFEWDVRLNGGARETWHEDWRYLGPLGGRPAYRSVRRDDDGATVEQRTYTCVAGRLDLVALDRFDADGVPAMSLRLGGAAPWMLDEGHRGRERWSGRVALGVAPDANAVADAKTKALGLALAVVEAGGRRFRAYGTQWQLEQSDGTWLREVTWFARAPAAVPLRWRSEDSAGGSVEAELVAWWPVDRGGDDDEVRVDPKELVLAALERERAGRRGRR